MRIVAGSLGGRRLSAPRGAATRPTSDRVREAVFSGLESAGAIAGARVLDAFGGTGALALEALSRGAQSAVIVEKAEQALCVLRANVDALGLVDSTRILSGDVFSLAGHGVLPGGPFSLLFLDPPYKLDKFMVRGLIESLVASRSLTADAVVVWEHATGESPQWPSGFSVMKEKRYGDTTVSVASGEGVEEVR